MKIAAALLVGLTMSANAEQLGPATTAWDRCLAAKTHELASERDSAEVVADSILELCSGYRDAAFNEMQEGRMRKAVAAGRIVDMQTARHLAASAEADDKLKFVALFKRTAVAQIVSIRANHPHN